MKFLVKAFRDKFLGEEYRFGIFVPKEIIDEIEVKELNAALLEKMQITNSLIYHILHLRKS